MQISNSIGSSSTVSLARLSASSSLTEAILIAHVSAGSCIRGEVGSCGRHSPLVSVPLPSFLLIVLRYILAMIISFDKFIEIQLLHRRYEKTPTTEEMR